MPVNYIQNEVGADNFYIELGNCGTSSTFTPTLRKDCIVIKHKKTYTDKKVVLYLTENGTVEVRFFKNEGNTYNTKCNLSESDCNLTKIADFLANGETELVHSNESTNLRTKLISFISSLNKWNVVASVTGGSHKRYRKSRKYKSRKQSRRHIQRRKRTHRHKSRRSRK